MSDESDLQIKFKNIFRGISVIINYFMHRFGINFDISYSNNFELIVIF